MRYLLIAIAAVLTIQFATAADQYMRLVRPTGASIKLVQLQQQNDLSAKFEGQLWVTGTFIAVWPGGAKAMAYKEPDYMLVPDAASVAKLPHFVLHTPKQVIRYKVKAIDLQNGEAALRMTILGVQADRLLNREIDSVRATGRFLVDSYVVGVECDAPWARGVLIKTDLPKKEVLAHRSGPERC
jgi:hypothetical protein